MGPWVDRWFPQSFLVYRIANPRDLSHHVFPFSRPLEGEISKSSLPYLAITSLLLRIHKLRLLLSAPGVSLSGLSSVCHFRHPRHPVSSFPWKDPVPPARGFVIVFPTSRAISLAKHYFSSRLVIRTFLQAASAAIGHLSIGGSMTLV